MVDGIFWGDSGTARHGDEVAEFFRDLIRILHRCRHLRPDEFPESRAQPMDRHLYRGFGHAERACDFRLGNGGPAIKPRFERGEQRLLVRMFILKHLQRPGYQRERPLTIKYKRVVQQSRQRQTGRCVRFAFKRNMLRTTPAFPRKRRIAVF